MNSLFNKVTDPTMDAAKEALQMERYKNPELVWPPKSKQSNVKTLGTYLVSKAREMTKTTLAGEDEVAVVEEEEEVTEEAEAVAEVEAGVVGEVVATRMLGITALMTGASSIRSNMTKS